MKSIYTNITFYVMIQFFFLINMNIRSEGTNQHDAKVIPKKTERVVKEISTDIEDLEKSKSTNIEEIRKRKKYQIALSQSIFSLSLQYNWNSKISIATTTFYKDGYRESTGFVNLYHTKENYSRQILQINLKFFPFVKFPMYLTSGIGRNFVGQFFRKNNFGSFKSSTNTYSSYYETIEEDYNSFFYLDTGVGFQWVLENGLLFCIEGHNYQPYKIKHHTHYYDWSAGDRENPLVSYFIYREINKSTESQLYSRQIPEILLWIGYAF
ncbi:MAG: hypothetical protein KDK90_15725 [Leptospiraceae bacterium]|nr:hypothetical protein [Leptospiraceae bacterium]